MELVGIEEADGCGSWHGLVWFGDLKLIPGGSGTGYQSSSREKER